MHKLDKRYIGEEQIGSEQIELLNNTTFQAKKFNGVDSLDLFKIDSNDSLQFLTPINIASAAANPTEAVRKMELDVVSDMLARRYYEFSDVLMSTTSNTVFSTALTLVTPDLPVGNYKLDINTLHGLSATGRLMNLVVQVNGVDIRSRLLSVSNINAEYPTAMFAKLNGISGVQTITISFKLNAGTGTARIIESSLELYQVGA